MINNKLYKLSMKLSTFFLKLISKRSFSNIICLSTLFLNGKIDIIKCNNLFIESKELFP